MTFPNILLMIHSALRWLVVLFALAVLVGHGISLARKTGYPRRGGLQVMLFTMTLSLQWVLGLVMFIVYLLNDLYQSQQVEHLIMMTVAVALAHITRGRWAEADGAIRTRNELLGVLGSLVLIFIGVMLLPGGIVRWMR